jgi:glutamyl-tRNA synthetase
MALFNLIFARHHQGKFILRIEDTDQSRSRPEYEENIYKALKWCGFEWDEGPDCGGEYGPYRQSERLPIYKEYCQQLLDAGKAYKCFCTPEELAEMREIAAKRGGRGGYDRRHRNLSPEEIAEKEAAGLSYVIRLKVPLTGECEYIDGIKGRCTFPWADVDDQVLLKSDGFPTYHLANVVDDHLMEISHIIRGDEWISSTPKHVLLYEYFGWEAPQFMHMPLLLGMDGKKLSKRKNPTSLFFYRDSGYLPEAFVNFLSLMGYSMTEDREVYDLAEIIRDFDAKRIGVSGAVFDVRKLDWLNQQYIINNIPQDQLWERMKGWLFNDAFIERLMPLCHTRIRTFGDFMDLFQFMFVNDLPYSEELLVPKRATPAVVAALIQGIVWHVEAQEDWSGKGIEAASRFVAESFGVHHKKVVMAVLFGSIMGKQKGPPLFDSVTILGRDRTRARLLQAMNFVGGLSNKQQSTLRKCWDAGDCRPYVEKFGSKD